MSPKETVTTKPIDLSKYAKGRKLRCVIAPGSGLIEGRVYKSDGVNQYGSVEVAGIGYHLHRFAPVEDEAPRFKPGDRVQFWDTVFGGDVPWHGLLATLVKKTSGGCWLTDHETFQVFHTDNFRPAPPVAASPKVDHNATCRCGAPFHTHDGVGGDKCNSCCERSSKPDPYAAHRLRANDAYHGELMNRLDVNSGRRARLVAALAAEMVRKPIEPRFPPEGRSCRVYRGNDR